MSSAACNFLAGVAAQPACFRRLAKRAQELVRQEGSLAAYVWRYEPAAGQLAMPPSASTSAASIALSKDLNKRGWKFVGPTTVYAFMQAMGLINDHAKGCAIRAEVERARGEFRRPTDGG